MLIALHIIRKHAESSLLTANLTDTETDVCVLLVVCQSMEVGLEIHLILTKTLHSIL